jgi:LCP family protein required for cell wall assembly
MTADDQRPAGRSDGQDGGQDPGNGGPDAQPARSRRQHRGNGAPGPQSARNRARAKPAAPAPPAASAGSNHHATRQRFQRRIATSQRARRQRFVLIIVAAMSVATLLVSCGAWVVTSYISAGLARLDAGTSGTPASGPINILVVGVDSRGGLTPSQEARLHVGSDIGENTDTMMLVHIPADHDSVEVVSLPRDSWVSIPGHGMNKINAAYGIGGPQLMVSTVEQATGVDINDYVEVNFLGFVRVIDALGGVNVCLPYAVDDSDSGLHLSAGSHHVDGVTALEFARDRHSFPTSDLARISDQQQLLSSAFTEATTSGVLANPVRLQQVLASVTAAVRVDRGFNLIQLSDELRGVKASDVWFTTVPIASDNYQTPSGESAVLWNQPAAAALFNRIQTDTARPPRPAGPRGASLNTAAATSDTPHTATQDACG